MEMPILAVLFVCVVSHVAVVGAHPAGPTLMATLPSGSVAGISEVIQVTEDLSVADSPIVFRGIPNGASSFYAQISKSGEPIVPQDYSKLWGGRDAAAIVAEQSDLMGTTS